MGNKKAKQENGIRVFIVGIILICIVVGYYYYLSNRREKASEESEKEITAVQEMLLYNFEKNYPPTPKEVVKLFAQMTQCFYNETYTEEELLQLAAHIQNLYDDELIANKTENQYIEDFKWDINNFKEQGIVISSYAVSASTDVYYFTQDGDDFARLYCSFTLRKGTHLESSNEVFVLRKDDSGHWKIYGWTLDENDDEGQ